MHSRNRQIADSYVVPEMDSDMVEKPPHYNSTEIECIDAMAAMANGVERNSKAIKPTTHQSYLWQNTFKYLWRWPYKKKPVEDLRKARWYLNRLIAELEEDKSD